MDSLGLGRTPVEVGAFFTDTWRTYQKLLQHNHMHHRELYELVRRSLTQLPPGFRMLDLGCGDACYTAAALQEIPCQHYTGVDLSTVALALAAENLAPLGLDYDLITANFVEFVGQCQQQFELILMSFALHHLSYGDKDHFLGQLKTCLQPGGVFLLIDVFRIPGESLPQYYERYLAQAHRNQWQLTPAEFTTMSEHITSSDLPDAAEDLMQLGWQHGFKTVSCLFLHPETTIGLLKFEQEGNATR